MEGKHIKMKIITFINEKGGVGKTSACFNTAWELSNRGKKILMIDIDGQKANLTFFTGIERPNNMKTIIDVLRNGTALKDCIVPVKENLDLLPANASVASIGMDSKVSQFRSELGSVKEIYDYIFIDVTPSPGWGHYLALCVSDYAVIVMLPDVTSLEGDTGILDSIMEVQETTNPKLKIAGFLFNRNYDRTNLGREVLEVADRLATHAKTKVFTTKIPQAIALGECVARHQGVTDYAPNSKAADVFREFANELEMEIL